MSTPSGLFRSSRVLFSAAKSATTSTKKISAPTSKRTTAGAATASESTKSPKVNKFPVPNKGLMKPFPVSPTLRNIVGVPEISRAEAVKKIWEHIKSHNLQNPYNKREIVCDAKLKALFDGKDKVGFLEIGKLLTPHFVKTN